MKTRPPLPPPRAPQAAPHSFSGCESGRSSEIISLLIPTVLEQYVSAHGQRSLEVSGGLGGVY